MYGNNNKTNQEDGRGWWVDKNEITSPSSCTNDRKQAVLARTLQAGHKFDKDICMQNSNRDLNIEIKIPITFSIN